MEHCSWENFVRYFVLFSPFFFLYLNIGKPQPALFKKKNVKVNSVFKLRFSSSRLKPQLYPTIC